MYQQLLEPNLGVVGYSGLCLKYVTEVFGVPPKYPSASVAWQNARFKHTGTPPNNSVPIWFSWQVDGHVALWDNGLIYSTTAQGVKTFKSIQALMNYIGGGIAYLGWTEDINNVKVVGETMTGLTKQEIIVIYTLAFDDEDVDVPANIITAYTGGSLDGLLTQLAIDPSYLAHKQSVNNPPIPGLNKTNVEAYIAKNLQ